VREATAPFLRHHAPKSNKRAGEEPLDDSCEVQPTPAPKKALLVKARCSGSFGALSLSPSPRHCPHQPTASVFISRASAYRWCTVVSFHANAHQMPR
jgi:hypothetical protein